VAAVTTMAIIAPGTSREIRAHPTTITQVVAAIASALGSTEPRCGARFSKVWINRGAESTGTPSTLRI
jgi:hypothetical protein